MLQMNAEQELSWEFECNDKEIRYSLYETGKCADTDTPNNLSKMAKLGDGMSDQVVLNVNDQGEVNCQQAAEGMWVQFKIANSNAASATDGDTMNLELDGNTVTVADGGQAVNVTVDGNSVSVADGGQAVNVTVPGVADASMSNMDSYKVSGDGYDIKVDTEKVDGGEKMTSQMKFDRYYMHGIDQMGGKDGSPPCGPGVEDQCKELAKSDQSCCTKVVMTNMGSGDQESMYRCMNMKIVDANMAMEIDGIKMSMSCSDKGATYITSAIMASMAALFTMATF